ncbi:MAG: Asp-tRNA(Asn)/Glu-tRNA(Gln) amidotransferase subunit GatA [Patescibacteria group bacterium]
MVKGIRITRNMEIKLSERPTIAEVRKILSTEQISVTQLTEYFLERSKKIDREIKSVLRWNDEFALKRAKILDQLLEENKRKGKSFDQLLNEVPLFGIPFTLKDNILVENLTATSASKLMDDWKATYSATVYKLLENAGAVLICQVNQDEWAVGCSTENSAFQTTVNPYGKDRVPGGSSGGPAAVVGSGQVVFSLGSDTGGSIRQPSAFCNSVGVKPTYGLVSRYGIMALASSLDQVGPITHCVADNSLVLSILAAHDSKDQTSLTTDQLQTVAQELYRLGQNFHQQEIPGPSGLADINSNKSQDNSENSINSFPLQTSTDKFKIGIPAEYYEEGLDTRIATKLNQLQSQLKEKFELVPVSLPLTKYGLSIYYITMTVETAANLERYDGVRYRPAKYDSNGSDMFFGIREELFGEEPKRRIMLGTYTSSAGYYDAYYNKANQVKAMMQQDFSTIFDQVDLLLCPTTPELPFKFGVKTNNPLAMYLSDAMVYGANLAKLPAISIPLSYVKDGDEILPIACQVIGPELSEAKIMSLGQEIEKFFGL